MRRLSFVLLIACMSAAVFAGGRQEKGLSSAGTVSAEPKSGPMELTVNALKGPTSIGMIRLFERNPDLGGGVTADYQIAGAPDVLVSRILSNEVDIAVLPVNIAVKLYNSGVQYSLGAIVGNGLLYMLSSDPEVAGIDDVRGKEIYNVGKGATPDFVLRYLLNARGIGGEKGASVLFTYSHPELAQMMIAEKVTTAVLPEPFVTMVTMKNEDVHIVEDLQKVWSEELDRVRPYPMSVVVIKDEVRQKRPDAVEAFLEAYKESIEWVGATPKAAGELAEQHGIGIPAAVAARAIPRLNLTFVPASEAREEMERFLKVFMEYDPKAIGGKLPDEGFYGE
jgi:NitT/TauT family transport system substrate-binding protein